MSCTELTKNMKNMNLSSYEWNNVIYPCFVSGLTCHRSNRSEIYLPLTCHPLRFCLCADSSQLIFSYKYSLIHHTYILQNSPFFDLFSSMYNEYFAPTFLPFLVFLSCVSWYFFWAHKLLASYVYIGTRLAGAVFSAILYNLHAQHLFWAPKIMRNWYNLRRAQRRKITRNGYMYKIVIALAYWRRGESLPDFSFLLLFYSKFGWKHPV